MSPNTSGLALRGLGKRTRRGEWEGNRPAECKENQFNAQKAKGRKCIKEEGVLDCIKQFRDMRAENWPPDLATQSLTIASSPDKSQWVSLRENGRGEIGENEHRHFPKSFVKQSSEMGCLLRAGKIKRTVWFLRKRNDIRMFACWWEWQSRKRNTDDGKEREDF